MAASYLQDRELVILVTKRFVEILLGDETQSRFDKEVDPNKPGANNLLYSARTIVQDAERQALRECGIPGDGSVYVFGEIQKLYRDDQEVTSLLEFLASHGALSQHGSNKVGDLAKDVNLVTMDTKETVPFSSFQSGDRPLMVIASSFS